MENQFTKKDKKKLFTKTSKRILTMLKFNSNL